MLESLKANKCGAFDQSNLTTITNLKSDEKSKRIELCPDTKLRLFFAHSTVLSIDNLMQFLEELQKIGLLDKIEIISLDGVIDVPKAVIRQFPTLFIDAGNCIIAQTTSSISDRLPSNRGVLYYSGEEIQRNPITLE